MTRGPVPKRDSERIRRNKPDVPMATIHAIGAVKVPELGLDDPHTITQQLWDSMCSSAQSKYYEDSDYAYARMTLYFINQQIQKGGRVNGQVLATVASMLSDLLVSEGSRRKVRVEVEREVKRENITDIAQLFRDRLAK